jgi:tetratricopeptide (TPR) repeat protein
MAENGKLKKAKGKNALNLGLASFLRWGQDTQNSQQKVLPFICLLLTFSYSIVNFYYPKSLLAQEQLKDFNYWGSLCDLLADEKKYAEAVAACDQAIALNPNQAKTWTDRIEGLLGQAKYTEALVSADKALGIKPDYSLALADRCIALVNLGKYEDAIASCDKALISDGNWGNNGTPLIAWYNKGLAQTKLGQYAEAIALMKVP